jgi:tetratricopeptide (TPR) repeat protein
MRRNQWIWSGIVCAAMTAPAALVAQAPAGSVHGHANNPIGQVLVNVQVKFTKDMNGDVKDRKFLYTATTDASGNFKLGDIPPGTYFVELADGPKNLDFNENVIIKPNVDLLLDFDLSRPAYIAKLTDEEKKTIAEYKQKNAAASEANVKINNLNGLLKSVRADLASPTPNYDSDVKQMQDATTALPTESVLWMQYGSALSAKSDHMMVEDHTAHKPTMSDDALMAEYQQAIDAFRKGVDLNASSKKPSPGDEATALNSLGSDEAKIGKTADADAAFEQAVKLDPTHAGMYYGNEAAVLFNSGNTQAAGTAADKAIAADPTRADPYFIKGQALVGQSTVDKAGKIIPPPGCVEAYQKYLELDPDGRQAPTVEEILKSMGQTINTKYRASKKK